MSISRIQLALNVADLEASTRFYSKLFGVEPHKERPGYANFVVADPPLKLVLFENPEAESALNHLGVEVSSPDDVVAVAGRLVEQGLETRASVQEQCCHAVQDKMYVTAPDVPLGQWEFYTVLDDDPVDGVSDGGTCCPAPAAEEPVCCG